MVFASKSTGCTEGVELAARAVRYAHPDKPPFGRRARTASTLSGMRNVRARFALVPPAAFLAGCAGIGADSKCRLTPEFLSILHARTYQFMEDHGWNSECEELSEHPHYLDGDGCAIYGDETNGAKTPRTGAACPRYLDGGYYVVFDAESVQPKYIVTIEG